VSTHCGSQLETLLGQGTLALEFDQQARPLDTLLVAVGGGGLIGGIAAWFSRAPARDAVKIIGVEPEAAPTLTCALRAGEPVDSPAGGIAADSLAPRRVGELMFPLARERVSDVLPRLWTLRPAREPQVGKVVYRDDDSRGDCRVLCGSLDAGDRSAVRRDASNAGAVRDDHVARPEGRDDGAAVQAAMDVRASRRSCGRRPRAGLRSAPAAQRSCGEAF